jgi:hypothetical protein
LRQCFQSIIDLCPQFQRFRHGSQSIQFIQMLDSESRYLYVIPLGIASSG